MNSGLWLRFAEYTALIASVGGSIAAVVSQQVLWATSPMLLSLGLNLVNRQRELTAVKNKLEQKIALEDLNNRRLNHLEMQFTQWQGEQDAKVQQRQGLSQRIEALEQRLAQGLNQSLANPEAPLSPTAEETLDIDGINHLMAEVQTILERISPQNLSETVYQESSDLSGFLRR